MFFVHVRPVFTEFICCRNNKCNGFLLAIFNKHISYWRRQRQAARKTCTAVPILCSNFENIVAVSAFKCHTMSAHASRVASFLGQAVRWVMHPGDNGHTHGRHRPIILLLALSTGCNRYRAKTHGSLQFSTHCHSLLLLMIRSSLFFLPFLLLRRV